MHVCAAPESAARGIDHDLAGRPEHEAHEDLRSRGLSAAHAGALVLVVLVLGHHVQAFAPGAISTGAAADGGGKRLRASSIVFHSPARNAAAPAFTTLALTPPRPA